VLKVAFHLRRKAEVGPEPASAAWLEGDDVEGLLGLVAAGSSDRSPPIHRTAGGFLARLDGSAAAPPGSIRLRRLAPNLYLPVDADLIPALLDDEAAALTRERGLIFLPGGRILGFDPASPLPTAALIAAERAATSDWRPFPKRPDRPDRIAEIVVDLPDAAGGDGLPGMGSASPGSEPGAGAGLEGGPRPEEAGAASTLAGRAILGAGRGMLGLGAALGIEGLARLGAGWIERAVRRAPRLTESLLGRQDSSLRELLRQFREGDVERALRHALPLGGQGGRGDAPAPGARLPEVDPTYSLGSLLGSGRGGGGIWFASVDVQAELAKEYRKAADEAERAGDFRRAAYIRGRLLNDFAAAAALLGRAGLHRDAAVLYLDRLDDPASAARAFEAAGDTDRALKLYRDRRMLAEAGDLLRRLGEDDAAVEAYVEAAEALAADSKHGLLAAGDLLRDRAGRADLALDFHARGWDARPAANSVECGLRLASAWAARGDSAALLALMDQADALFEGDRPAGSVPGFYNALARLADLDAMAPARDDLRDRALIGLAANLRRSIASGRPGPLISSHLGRGGEWPPDLVADAGFALRSASDRPVPRLGSAPARRIAVAEGTITAACHAAARGEVYLGYRSGGVYRVDIARGTVERIARGDSQTTSVSGLAVDPDGLILAILVERHGSLAFLYRRDRSVTYESPGHVCWQGEAPHAWITGMAVAGTSRAVGLWDGTTFRLSLGADLISGPGLAPPSLPGTTASAILLPPSEATGPRSEFSFLVHDGLDIRHVSLSGEMLGPLYLGWQPTLPEGSTLGSVPPAWLQADRRRFEIAGLDGDGVAHLTSLKLTRAELIRTANASWAGDPAPSAIALVRPGLMACAHQGGVSWVRAGARGCALAGITPADLASPLACFADPRSGELVVVRGDGTLACLPIVP